MLTLVISVGVGAALGGALGYFGQCSSGTCPLTATWWRGALFGALFGVLFYTSSGRDAAGARELRRPDGPVKPVAEAEFDAAVLGSEVPVLVDFYATWCGPCKRLAPTLAAVAGDYAGRVKFVKVDVDAAPTVARRYDVTGVPTLAWFREGRLQAAMAGAPAESELRARLDAWLKAGPTPGSGG